MVVKKPVAPFTKNWGTIRSSDEALDRLYFRFTTLATETVLRLLEESKGHSSLQILMLISSSCLLNENANEAKMRRWVGLSNHHIATGTGLSVATVERRIKCLFGDDDHHAFLIKGVRSHRRFRYAVQPLMFGYGRVAKDDLAQSRGGRPAFGKFKARLAKLVKDKLVRDSDHPGALAVLLWFICRTTSEKLNSENWIDVTQGDLAKVLHMKRDRVRSGFRLLVDEGVLKKHNDRRSYRLSNRYYQCGSKSFDS